VVQWQILRISTLFMLDLTTDFLATFRVVTVKFHLSVYCQKVLPIQEFSNLKFATAFLHFYFACHLVIVFVVS